MSTTILAQSTDETSSAVLVDDVGADSYEYRLDGGSAVNVGSDPLFLVPSLSNGVSYTIEVREVTDGVESEWSSVTNFTTGPLTTTFNDSGSWTPLNEEKTLLFLVSQYDHARFEVVGQSVEGRDIHVAIIGYPTPPTIDECADLGCVYTISTLHGNEVAGREALFNKMIELVYNASTNDESYLTNHPWVFTPIGNPDGFPDSRFNANGNDLNRKWISLSEPEVVALTDVIRRGSFDLIPDLHEQTSSSNDIDVLYPKNENIDLGLRNLCEDFVAELRSSYDSAGISNGLYNGGTGPHILRNMGGLRNSMTLLVETVRGDDPVDRVAWQYHTVEFYYNYHRDNSALIASTRATAIENQILKGRNADSAYSDPDSELNISPPPMGYGVTAAQLSSFQWYIDKFGLKISNNIVGMQQPLSGFIPMVMDDGSSNGVVSGERKTSLAKGVASNLNDIGLKGVNVTQTNLDTSTVENIADTIESGDFWFDYAPSTLYEFIAEYDNETQSSGTIDSDTEDIESVNFTFDADPESDPDPDPSLSIVDFDLVEYDSVSIGNTANFTMQEVQEAQDPGSVILISPDDGAQGVSRTPTLLFNEEGDVPAERYYQLNIVSILTQDTEPDFSQGLRITQPNVPVQDTQSFELEDLLDTQQWYAWKIVAKLMPEQAQYVETFEGNDGDPLPNDWETEVLV